MCTVKTNFKSILNLVYVNLKKHGYKRQASTFYINNHNNQGIINFQKSLSSNSSEIKFTINFGVRSTVVANFDVESNISKVATVSQCCWSSSLKETNPEILDYWYIINDQTNVDLLAETILSLIEGYGIQKINSHISDQQLITHWENLRTKGLPEIRRLKLLSILYKGNKLDADFNNAIEQLQILTRDSDNKSSIKVFIKYLKDYL